MESYLFRLDEAEKILKVPVVRYGNVVWLVEYVRWLERVRMHQALQLKQLWDMNQGLVSSNNFYRSVSFGIKR